MVVNTRRIQFTVNYKNRDMFILPRKKYNQILYNRGYLKFLLFAKRCEIIIMITADIIICVNGLYLLMLHVNLLNQNYYLLSQPGMPTQTTQFSRSSKESRGDTSVWTDTPSDKAQKAKMKYVFCSKMLLCLVFRA